VKSFSSNVLRPCIDKDNLYHYIYKVVVQHAQCVFAKWPHKQLPFLFDPFRDSAPICCLP
jgi:hypothetical protein